MTSPREYQTNRLLGYPADARLLIINADDFGMCHSVNEAILSTLKEGVVSSTSLMAPCPWAPHAMQILRDHPDISFGVHLTLICDFDTYRWGPVSSRDKVPSLVDASGYFFSNDRRAELLAQATLDDVEVEFRAQISAVLNARLTPSQLDWHCLADGGRADIFELTLRLANEYGLAIRIHERLNADACQVQGFPTNDFDVLDSYSLKPDEKRDRYTQLLRALPAGLNEWAVHPSLGNAESQALEPDSWQIRRADFDYFMSLDARDILEEEGIILCDYRAVQLAWPNEHEPG